MGFVGTFEHCELYLDKMHHCAVQCSLSIIIQEVNREKDDNKNSLYKKNVPYINWSTDGH